MIVEITAYFWGANLIVNEKSSAGFRFCIDNSFIVLHVYMPNVYEDEQTSL